MRLLLLLAPVPTSRGKAGDGKIWRCRHLRADQIRYARDAELPDHTGIRIEGTLGDEFAEPTRAARSAHSGG